MINEFFFSSTMRIFGGHFKQTVARNEIIPSMSTVSFCSLALIHAGCGPVIDNTLRSPGYPNDYPNNADCTSSVPIPQGMVIKITINKLYLEDSISCE